MALPDFTEDGYLPEGVHDATLDEVGRQFGRFQESDRRPALFLRLSEFVATVRGCGLFEAIIVDGSFVTVKASPNDVDLIAVLRPGHDFERDLPMSEYALLSRPLLRRRFDFDVLIAESGTPLYESYIEYFSQIRELPNRAKGLIRLRL